MTLRGPAPVRGTPAQPVVDVDLVVVGRFCFSDVSLVNVQERVKRWCLKHRAPYCV